MAIYLDDDQREALASLRNSWTWRSEWPTWLLIVVIYGSWFGFATHARQLGLPIAAALLAVLGAWYMSLQHELLHGHPTRWPFINALIGAAPLAVWLASPPRPPFWSKLMGLKLNVKSHCPSIPVASSTGVCT